MMFLTPIRSFMNILKWALGNFLSLDTFHVGHELMVFKEDDGNLPTFPQRTQAKVAFPDLVLDIVLSAISELNDKLSLTPEGFPSFFIKRSRMGIAYPLLRIINYSMMSGSLPDLWKCAIVSPLLKKSPAYLAANYRPISLISSFGKVMEILIKKYFTDHLVSHQLLNPAQFGFLQNKSTNLQVVSALNDWIAAVNNQAQVDAIYFDIAKAFDIVSHPKLLHKLGSYGISGPVAKWIKSFVSDRTFVVKVGDRLSSAHKIASGVPQGSVLSPLLFLIYINDVTDELTCSCKLFADDLKIYRPVFDPVIDFPVLQQDLNTFNDWTKA